MTGPLTATGAQGASRFEVVGKSPMLMPEGFCYGNMGGFWDPETDDTVAEFNFTDPVQSVFMNPDVLVPGEGDTVLSRKGQTLDRDIFKKMKKEFYQLRGWHPETGCPTKEKLHELGLADLDIFQQPDFS